MAAALETHNLTKRYGSKMAVDGLSLTVEQGDLFGFLGPNGAGKSTTLRMALGLVRPNRGRTLIFGRDVWHNKPAALRNVGALVETPSFYRFLTARQNLMVLGRTGGDVSKAQIGKTLETVGLADRADDKVGAYSHGMRQRLGIGLALLTQPDLVVLDEPTTGLDPEGMREIRDLIKGMREESPITVLLSSHLLHEIEQICNKVAIIDRGRVVAQGSVREMLEGKNSFEIRTATPRGAADVVEQVEWACVESVSENFIVVQADKNRSAELNKLLVDRGVEVEALIPRRHTLEDVYLSITGAGEDADSDQA